MKMFKVENYFGSDFLVKRIPKTTYENLKSLDIIPDIPQNEIINTLSATSFVACSDFREIMKMCLRLWIDFTTSPLSLKILYLFLIWSQYNLLSVLLSYSYFLYFISSTS
jgi:hypothetical protein